MGKTQEKRGNIKLFNYRNLRILAEVILRHHH